MFCNRAGTRIINCFVVHNRIKGDRPMEYLRMKIDTREKMLNDQVFFGE
ncbi:MAG: hypothetical protein LBN39_02460 [Planctomycetaceae bacterium]|jgi:hypothetical protein|nr:hypothetical protein [Planctomycetaceae bacterium]